MQGIGFIQDLAVIFAVAGLVGWACQRVGLSVVVGYLVAGMVVGPHTPPFALVTDTARVDMAAQMGLVFLMFSIGLRLSLQRLRRLGMSLLVAVFMAAGVMFYLVRLLGAAVGLDAAESLFLAGMLMVSSSAIITKVLQETGATHERSGQLAMGVTVLEDVVAVVMLTLLMTYVGAGGGEAATGIGLTLTYFGAFVMLAGVAGLLVVPWLLRRMSIAADEELQTLGMAGLLFALAIVAHRSGYSVALGAFLLGTIVAETPHRHQVERTFEGVRDMFSAVFFVAIGMQIDPELLVEAGGLIVGVAAFTLVARSGAAALGLVLIGNPPRDALRAGMAVTPIGEFSFIIAQMGILAGVVPRTFYPLAVGVSLLTTLVAPALTRRSEGISAWLVARQPRWAELWVTFYHEWLDRLHARRQRNLLWKLTGKRFRQVGLEMLLVTGVIVFAERILDWIGRDVPRDWLFPHGPVVLFWLGLMVVVLVPLVAIWRNISALALLIAQVSVQGRARAPRLARAVEALLKTAAAVALYVWLSSLLPVEGVARFVLLATVLGAVAVLLLLKRRLIYWHSELEVELNGVLDAGQNRLTGTAAPWLKPHQAWNVTVSECVLPDLAKCQGRQLAELDLRAQYGCTVVGVERQGYMISLPAADTVLFPRDKVLVMGTTEQVAAGKRALTEVAVTPAVASEFDEIRMEAVAVPPGSLLAGQSLRELSLAQTHRIQVAGLERAGSRRLNPGADEVLLVGDELLVIGTPEQIATFKEVLREKGPEPASGK